MTLRIALTVFLAVAIVIGAFAFFIPHANRSAEQAPVSAEPLAPPPVVTLTDSYKKGVHTISGTVQLSTPCTSMSAVAEVASGTPEVIRVEITSPRDTGVCLELATQAPFKLTVTAGAGATIVARVNGVTASTTAKTP